MKNIILLDKKVGQTPLELLNNFREKNIEYKDQKMAFAGRLDPMASGLMLFLVGEKCKNRDEYQDMEKEYEFDVLFGIESDTYDVLGIINSESFQTSRNIKQSQVDDLISKHTGDIMQEYPPYSSFHVDGKPLWWWAKNNKLDRIEIPSKKVKVRSLQFIGKKEIKLEEFVHGVIQNIQKVEGDFRQEEIAQEWKKLQNNYTKEELQLYSFKATVSSGTYVRSIVHNMGKDLGIGALATRIHRTSIGQFNLTEID